MAKIYRVCLQIEETQQNGEIAVQFNRVELGSFRTRGAALIYQTEVEKAASTLTQTEAEILEEVLEEMSSPEEFSAGD